MNQSDMYSLARVAGLPADKAEIAAAIGMAESGGNPNSHNGNAGTGDDSYGLWQINMLGSLGPARRVQFGISKNTDLLDPKVNAKAMSILSHQGQNFGPWTTYTTSDATRSYKRFMGVGAKAYADAATSMGKGALGALGNITVTPIESAVAAAQGLLNAVNKSAAWVSNSKNWVRVAFVVGGLTFVTVGTVTLAKPYLSGAISDVATVVMGGGNKVMKAAKMAGGKGAS